MKIDLSAEKYALIHNCHSNFKLKSIEALWDGHGGLEFEFNPQISDRDIRNDLEEVLSEIIEDAGFFWNLNIEMVSSTDSETLLELTETRNLSEIGDVSFDNSDFLSADVCSYILINYDLNIDECECVISYSLDGCYDAEKPSEMSYSSNGDFSFILINDEDEIDVADDELEKIIARVVHNYMVNFCSMGLSYFDYNFEFMDGELNDISLILNPITISLRRLD
ncbi:hypothetical protein V7S76_06320 [Aquirufa sp. ROCK2-A2]